MKAIVKIIVGTVIAIIGLYLAYIIARHIFVFFTLILEEFGFSDNRLMPEDINNMFRK